MQLEISDQTFTNFISVIGNPGYSPPIYEGFETISSIPNNDWTVSNPNGPGFEVVSTASYSGSQSVKLDNSQGTNGSIDELITLLTYQIVLQLVFHLSMLLQNEIVEILLFTDICK